MDPADVGKSSSIVLELLQSRNIADLNLLQSQHVIRHWANHTIIWQYLKRTVLQAYKKREDYQADTEKKIEQLYLNDDLLFAIFSGTTQSVWLRAKVDVFRKCREDDMMLYYILRGNVIGVDNQDRSVVLDRYKAQEFFEITEEINSRRRFVASAAVEAAKQGRPSPTDALAEDGAEPQVEPAVTK